MEVKFRTRWKSANSSGRIGNHVGPNDFLDMVVLTFPRNPTHALYIVSNNFNLSVIPYRSKLLLCDVV